MNKIFLVAGFSALMAGSLLACDGMSGPEDHASLGPKKTCVMAHGKICKTKADKNLASVTVKKDKI